MNNDEHERAGPGTAGGVEGAAHLATIVALSTGVLQGIEGDRWIFVQEHLELACADAQVVLVEFIWDVPAYGTKLAAFLHANQMVLQLGSQSVMLLGLAP